MAKTHLYELVWKALEEKPVPEYSPGEMRKILMKIGVDAARIVAREILGEEHPGTAWFPILHGVLDYWFDWLHKIAKEYEEKGAKVKRLPTPEELAREVLSKPEVLRSILEYAKRRYPRVYEYLVKKFREKGLPVA